MKRAIIFDIGGTLEELKKDQNQRIICGKQLLSYMGIHGIKLDITAEQLMDTIETNNVLYRDWAMTTYREVSPYEIWSKWYLKDFDISEESLRLIANNLATIREEVGFVRFIREDAAETLKKLKDRGFSLGVISNTTSCSMAPGLLIKYGISEYFDTFYLSSLSGFRKPHPGLFKSAAMDLGVEPSSCIYVGDTVSRDVHGARAAGYLSTIRIESDVTKSIDHGYVKGRDDADYVISKLGEIPDIADAVFKL